MVGFEQVLPVSGALEVFLVVGLVLLVVAGEEGDDEVVVGVLDCAGDGSRVRAFADHVDVVLGDVA